MPAVQYMSCVSAYTKGHIATKITTETTIILLIITIEVKVSL
jgi:hypothetical protein